MGSPFSENADPSIDKDPALPSWVNPAIEYCLSKVRSNLQELTDFPELTRDGRWVTVENGGWVGGHWVGLLWLAYAHTSDDVFLSAALNWAARLAPRQLDITTHDLGFLFELSHLLGARLTGDASLSGPPLAAAQTLSQRYNPRGSFIPAWGPPDADTELRGRTIIDTLMNLPLLFWASQETGNPEFAHIAVSHAKTCLGFNVRADWSTAHVADFDPQSGKFIKQDTHQGLSPTSCWSRGQSWGVYGFAEAFRFSRVEEFLIASRNLARYALGHLPEDRIPYWDYASPLAPQDVRDTSAAAILASALLRLSRLETASDPSLAGYWRESALQILESLDQSFTSRDSREPSILLHGTRSKPHNLADHGLIYGDYYFLEALTCLAKPKLLGT